MKDSKISVVSLLNGQDIIGTVSYKGDSLVHLDKPAAIVVQPGPGGLMKMGLAPWPPLADQTSLKKDGIDINRDLIVAVYTPNLELLNGYEQTMSNLVLPPKPMLITE